MTFGWIILGVVIGIAFVVGLFIWALWRNPPLR